MRCKSSGKLGSWLYCAVAQFLIWNAVALLPQCDGVEEEGIRWDAVREDLGFIVVQVLEGALSRDLQASKDTKGRDPAVSYGDVQLQRHLERFQRLAEILPEHSVCTLGRHTVRLFVSALYSGLPWHVWLRRYEDDLEGLFHRSNWTAAEASGWPVLELLIMLSSVHGGVDVSATCGTDARLAVDDALLDGPQSVLQNWAQPLRRRPPCPFARTVAGVALATTATAPGRSQRGAAPQIGKTQAELRALVGTRDAAAYALSFTEPLPSLLMRLSTEQKRHTKPRTARLDIVYCGELDITDALSEMCSGHRGPCRTHVKSTESRQETREACYSHYRGFLDSLASTTPSSAEDADYSSTLLLSPFLWQWNPDVRRDLERLVGEQRTWRREVFAAGLPCVNSSRIWNWPVQRLRHGYWKLAYTEYATGHETSPLMPLSQFWAVGDTTSGTRVYETRALADLMRRLRQREAEYPSKLPPAGPGQARVLDVSEVFVELDLASHERKFKPYTLLQGSVLEDNYRKFVSLSPHLSRSFHVEAARFLPNSAQQKHCLFPSSREASAFTQDHGVVVSWCTRKALSQMFWDVGRWWLSLNPKGHIIVPVSASVLNIFRSGETELFPWDADIDANFIANHPIVVGGFLEEHEEELARMGYGFILRGDRAVIRTLEDTARMDIWLSGPQDVEMFNIRSRLCGVRVNFFPEQLAGSVWYYRPGEKIYGNTKGKLLHCTWPEHNACLPDCVRDGRGIGPDGCEFPDRFVHLDT